LSCDQTLIAGISPVHENVSHDARAGNQRQPTGQGKGRDDDLWRHKSQVRDEAAGGTNNLSEATALKYEL